MKRSMVLITILAAALIGCTGCEPPEQIARNVIASGSGAIAKAQASYTTSCIANPAQHVCQIINRTVDGENAAVTALETYCSVSPGGDVNGKCVPVKSAQGGLTAAIANLNQLIGELKGAAHISTLNRHGIWVSRNQKQPALPLHEIPIDEAGITPGAISLAILGLKLLLQNVLKGEAGEYTQEAIDAAQGAITELEQVQGTEVTLGQLESLRLHKLWPDAPAGSGTAAGDAIGGSATGSGTTTGQ